MASAGLVGGHPFEKAPSFMPRGPTLACEEMQRTRSNTREGEGKGEGPLPCEGLLVRERALLAGKEGIVSTYSPARHSPADGYLPALPLNALAVGWLSYRSARQPAVR